MKKSKVLENIEEVIINRLEALSLTHVSDIELAQSYIKTLSMINPVIVSLKIREKKEEKRSMGDNSGKVIPVSKDYPDDLPF